jgi:hypothetical protein
MKGLAEKLKGKIKIMPSLKSPQLSSDNATHSFRRRPLAKVWPVHGGTQQREGLRILSGAQKKATAKQDEQGLSPVAYTPRYVTQDAYWPHHLLLLNRSA